MQFLNIGPAEMLLILVLALIVFGPGKLPEIGRAVGKSIGEFRRATSDLTREFSASIDEVRQPFDEVKGALTGAETATTATAAATAAGLTCPNCSASNPLTNRFCRECGARLVPDEPTVTCTFCQASNPASNKFCRECGSPMPVAEPVVEAPVESPNFAATGFAAAEATSEVASEVASEPVAEAPAADTTETVTDARAYGEVSPAPAEDAPASETASAEVPPAEVAEKAS